MMVSIWGRILYAASVAELATVEGWTVGTIVGADFLSEYSLDPGAGREMVGLTYVQQCC